MKRIYKNNENKQRVRILATGELGTVTDRVLMKRSGTPMLYYQVKLDDRPDIDRWYWDDQLGDIRERCRVSFENEDGKAIFLDMEHDHEREEMKMGLSAEPKLTETDRGLYIQMAYEFMKGIANHG